ncbi:ribonuclease T2 family protein [Janthinobacterium fluminis]|uniref:Ribonuclease n=1 Tax=Janthinobacterium fluminis TaxID=2987524 RepID=A0ABT5JUJ3_9BURK|nr:ribonuclease [Janthinobacterium fluminis]MDC8756406.1 ribonuclease [Janthinobacterium fluminis]
MKSRQTFCFVALLALACGAQAERRPQRDAQQQSGVAGEFDYYAVALSWSPSFCAKRDDPGQCAAGRRLGFVLHGLWPQYVNGYPQNCTAAKLSPPVRAKYASIYPSPGLIGHEWAKHGSCSGLEQAAYFDLSAKLKEQIVIPAAYRQPASPVRASNADFVQAFMAANPAMPANAVLPFCSDGGRFLSEMRACFDKSGGAQSCSAQEVRRSNKSCGQASFLMPNVR